MKQMTFEEFEDRTKAVVRARKIFTPHLTKNITEAFAIYQKVLAETPRSVMISSKEGGRRPQTIVDQFERPLCPECGEPLFLRIIKIPKGPRNKKGWKSCWVCDGPLCCYESYSKLDINQWLARLKRRNEDGER